VSKGPLASAEFVKPLLLLLFLLLPFVMSLDGNCNVLAARVHWPKTPSCSLQLRSPARESNQRFGSKRGEKNGKMWEKVVGTARMGESSHEREIKRERGQEGRFNARQVGYRKAKGRPYKKHTYDVIVKAAQTHTHTHTQGER